MYYNKSYGVKNTKLTLLGKQAILSSFWFHRYQLLLSVVVFYLSKIGCFVNEIEIKRSPFGLIVFIKVYRSFNFGNTKIPVNLLLQFFQKVSITLFTPKSQMFFKVKEYNTKTSISVDKSNRKLNNEIAEVVKLAMVECTAHVCAQVFAVCLAKTAKHQQYIDYIGSQFEQNFNFISKTKKLLGYYLVFSGRWGGSDRTVKMVYKGGKVSKQKIDRKLDYAFHECITPYGVCNIKIWLNYAN